MRISAKSRYALAALIQMGQNSSAGELITIASLSESLGISKIYLEQVFSLLKRGGIVTSTQGSQGGYQLARSMREISALDILRSIELALFQQADKTVADSSPGIESVLQNDVFGVLDAVIPETLKQITLETLVAKAAQYGGDGGMYYI